MLLQVPTQDGMGVVFIRNYTHKYFLFIPAFQFTFQLEPEGGAPLELAPVGVLQVAPPSSQAASLGLICGSYAGTAPHSSCSVFPPTLGHPCSSTF